MTISNRILKLHTYGSGCGWVRVVGYGINWKSPHEPALFSERYGHRSPFLRLWGWRIFFLGK
jgi:hypothetical protein